MRATGPEIGARTWVLRSPLNATVPLTSVAGRNERAVTGASSSRARCAAVTVPGGACSLGGCPPSLPPQAVIVTVTTPARSAARVRVLAIMRISGGSGLERRADGALQIGPSVVGGAERVGILAFGVEQRAA